MANTVANVSTGRPNVAGAIYVESASTSTLPTAADAALTGFTSLGYVSEDGVTNANTFSSTTIKEWGGSNVLTLDNDYADTFKFTLIESLNSAVLKEVFGDDNVTGSLTTGITVKAKAGAHDTKKWVIDMVMRGDVAKRICIPAASITAISEISYKADEAVGYEITLTCLADSTGVTHYEYIKG